MARAGSLVARILVIGRIRFLLTPLSFVIIIRIRGLLTHMPFFISIVTMHLKISMMIKTIILNLQIKPS